MVVHAWVDGRLLDWGVRLQLDRFPRTRTAPGMSQRHAPSAAPDGDTMHGVRELSKDGATWEQDLELRYTRIK
jgi:hypothetical protein